MEFWLNCTYFMDALFKLNFLPKIKTVSYGEYHLLQSPNPKWNVFFTDTDYTRLSEI